MKRPEACSHLHAVTISKMSFSGSLGSKWVWGPPGAGPCRCQVGTIFVLCQACRQAARLPGCSPPNHVFAARHAVSRQFFSTIALQQRPPPTVINPPAHP